MNLDTIKKGYTHIKNGEISHVLGAGLRGIGKRYSKDAVVAKKSVKRKYDDETKYLNIGGGQFIREDWRVLDHFTEWYDWDPIFIDYDVDLEETVDWPIPDEEFSLVYSSHTFEHLSTQAVKSALDEIYRVLEPGGGLRLNVPDISIAANHYKKKNVEWFRDIWLGKYNEQQSPKLFPQNNCAAEFYPEFYFISFFAGHLSRTQWHKTDFEKVRRDYQELSSYDFYETYTNMIKTEWQRENPGYHRNWFDERRLRSLLSDSGFCDIEVTMPNQSRYIEMCDPVAFDRRPHMSIYVDAGKPE